MSLFDIKKNADEKAAQELAERQHQELMRKLDVHPLVNLGCGRDVRDSYFAGIVFASLTDDVAVDDAERKLLLRICSSLGLPEEDCEQIITNASSAIAEMAKSAAQQVFDLLEEVAVALKEDSAFKIFVSEFVKVCAVKKFDVDQVKETLAKYVAPHSGHKMEEVPFDALCRVVQSGLDFNRDDLLKLADWLGEDATRYLMLDVFEDDVKPILDAHRTMLANRAALPAKLVGIIEGDGTWPVEFKPADYQPLFDAAGIVDVRCFVAQNVLPKAKAVYSKIRAGEYKRNELGWINGGDDYEYHGVIFESVKEFRVLFRYTLFMDVYLDLTSVSAYFYFSGPKDRDDVSYYRVCMRGEDLCYSRWRELEGRYPAGLANKTTLDRLQCSGWSPLEKDFERYFAQWEELFAAIEKRFVVNNSQDGGTAIQE